jgi:hypothetical protein
MLALVERFFHHDFESLLPMEEVCDAQFMSWISQIVGGKLKRVVQACG